MSLRKTYSWFQNALSLLFSVFILAGCASSEDIGRLQYDLIDLRAEVKDLKKPGQVGGQLDKRLKGLEEEQMATSKAVSDLFIKVQSLTGEMQVLTGRFEEARFLSEQSSRELSENKDTLIAQLKELEFTVGELEKRIASLGPAKTPVIQKKTGETEKRQQEETIQPEDARKTTTGEVKDVYMEIYRVFKEDKFSDAREQFETLLKDYPENEYSDNARFWIGETYYKESNYEDAILAYEELLKKNPNSEKVPGALLKQGLAFYELKDEVTGKIILEKLIEDYPDSEQAKIAKKKLRPPTPSKKKR
jgi:tol-pal system protein YbgF